MTSTSRDDAEQLADHLLTIRQFSRWVATNCLFPVVPDTVVHPLRDSLKQAEHILVTRLYDLGQAERVARVERLLKPPPRAPLVPTVIPGKEP